MEPTPITQQFVDALNQKFEGNETIFGTVCKFDAMPEEKFDRITLPRWDGTPGAAHAFVERETGRLFKAASWKYPVTDSKFNLNEAENFVRAVAVSDPYGIYLDIGNRYKSYDDPFEVERKPFSSYKSYQL
jgi:hypothetical protein